MDIEAIEATVSHHIKYSGLNPRNALIAAFREIATSDFLAFMDEEKVELSQDVKDLLIMLLYINVLMVIYFDLPENGYNRIGRNQSKKAAKFEFILNELAKSLNIAYRITDSINPEYTADDPQFKPDCKTALIEGIERINNLFAEFKFSLISRGSYYLFKDVTDYIYKTIEFIFKIYLGQNSTEELQNRILNDYLILQILFDDQLLNLPAPTLQ